jgi:hypothetical protein
MNGSGFKRWHTSGRSDLPNNAHKFTSVNCIQRMPAGLPFGMPGIGEDIDGGLSRPSMASEALGLLPGAFCIQRDIPI